MNEDLKASIRVIEDFPKKGISFKDITTLVQNGEAFHNAVERIAKIAEKYEFDAIICPESRGFIFGCAVAFALKKGAVLIRKPGKLPAETIRYDYQLEYRTDFLEMHKDAIKQGQRLIIVDDLLATGGTIEAAINMAEQLGGKVVSSIFLIELTELGGRQKLEERGCAVEALIDYPF